MVTTKLTLAVAMKQASVVSGHALLTCLVVLALHQIDLISASASHSNSINSVDVRVDLSRVNRTVHSDFLSVTIDASLIRSNWHGVDLKLPRLINMAKALAPCTLRVGGTSGDFILYSVSRYDRLPSHNIKTSRIKVASGKRCVCLFDCLFVFFPLQCTCTALKLGFLLFFLKNLRFYSQFERIKGLNVRKERVP